MYDKKYRDFVEAYQKVYEQKIGVPTDNPDATLQKIIDKNPKYGGGKVVPLTPSKSANIQNAHYELEGELIDEDFDIYDEVFEYLVSEGCTVEESKYIMTYVVEQGMHPQEVIGRGIANLLGFDKPHPTEVFARGLKKMLYPNKPVQVKAPKPPVKATAKPTTSKPNPYRPGATVRATGPNMDKFPELRRFADQGRKVAEPAAKTLGAAAAVRNITPAGVAASVMAPRPTGDATLSGALKRGDYKPKQGPKNPDQGLTRAQSFDKAYGAAKAKGGMGSTFSWRGKSYKVY